MKNIKQRVSVRIRRTIFPSLETITDHKMPHNIIGRITVLAALCCCVLVGRATAQQQAPEDPEDDKKLGLWLDQGISTGFTPASHWKSNFMNGMTK